MNRLRHLQAKRAVGRWMVYFILSVLAFRLLLPTGLMLDTSAEGDNSGFGLVICSGHGPLVVATLLTGSNTNFTVDNKAVNDVEHASAVHQHTPDASVGPDGSQSDGPASGEICAFSAAFMNALTAFAVILVFCHFTTLIVPRYRRQNFVFVQRLFCSSYSPRAPPMFV